MKKTHKPSPTPKTVFSSFDFEEVVPGHEDPMVIMAKIMNAKRIFIDQGSSTNIIF